MTFDFSIVDDDDGDDLARTKVSTSVMFEKGCAWRKL